MLLTAAVAATLSTKLLFRRLPPPGWRCEAAHNTSLLLDIPLRQPPAGVAAVHAAASNVATIGHPDYGKFLTAQQVRQLVQPEAATIEVVQSWVSSCGVPAEAVDRSAGDSWTIHTPAQQLECLLGGTVSSCVHSSGRSHTVLLGDVGVPAEVFDHVTFIPGVADFPMMQRRRRSHVRDLSKLDKGVISPKTLAALYGVPEGWYPAKKATLLVAEFSLGQGTSSYTPAYLFGGKNEPGFFKLAGVTANEATSAKVVGPFKTDDGELEANLDMQFAASTARGANLVYWTEDRWMYEFASGLNKGSGGVSAQNVDVVSISFAWSEAHQCVQPSGKANPTCTDLKVTTAGYIDRTNTEFAKLAAQGVTVVVSSGDDGAPGNFGKCDGKMIDPLYPAASPFVTTVGATAVTAGTSLSTSSDPICTDNGGCATGKHEIACQHPAGGITSGGGFSSYSARPKWQAAAVEQYLSSASLPKPSLFNSSGRGFPDVALVGHNYAVYLGSLDAADRFWIPTDGTSCATPVMAGLLALIRAQLGRRLGNAAPLLYQAHAKHPSAFNDVTQGDNKCTSTCCGGAGYVAAKGWDPVTGLGSVNVVELLKALSSLPPPPPA